MNDKQETGCGGATKNYGYVPWPETRRRTIAARGRSPFVLNFVGIPVLILSKGLFRFLSVRHDVYSLLHSTYTAHARL
jgi:hypothetical protein